MAPPRIRRRLEDQSAAAMANARKFRRPPNTAPPGLSFNRGPNTPPPGMGRDLTSGIASLRRPAVGNTAGRRPWTPGSTGRMIYSTPEENEDNRLSGIMSKLTQLPRRIGGALKDEFFGGAAAKTVSPTDPDVYRKGSFFGLGSKLTPQGKDINKAVEAYRRWNSRYGNQLDKDERLDIYKQNFQSNPREFYKQYPFSYDLGFTMDDLDEQGLLPEKAPEGYEWFNQGGIASLYGR